MQFLRDKYGRLGYMTSIMEDATIWHRVSFGVYRGSWKDTPDKINEGYLLCIVCSNKVNTDEIERSEGDSEFFCGTYNC